MRLIKNTINYDIDLLSNPKCIIYKCISKAVNFNIENCNANMFNSNDIREITQIYYNTYKNIGMTYF